MLAGASLLLASCSGGGNSGNGASEGGSASSPGASSPSASASAPESAAASPASASQASASPANASPQEKVTLSFWYGWTGPEGEAIEKLIKQFNDSHPNITVKGLSQSDYQKQLTAITGGNPPDIASQFGQNVAAWGTKGAMIPLDDYIAKDNVDLNDFIPGALVSSQYDGHTYALPIAMHFTMLFYNKKMLADAGYSAPPATMTELKEYAEKLSVVQKDGRLEVLGLWPGIDSYTFSQVYGGKFWDPDTKQVTPDDPGFKQAVQFSKDLWDKYGSENLDRFSASLGKYQSAQNPFFSGKYAMTIDGEWLPTFIKQFAPSLDYGIAPIPYSEDHPELKNAGNINTSVLYIPKGAKHPDASWEFIKWFTDKQQLVQFTAALGNLPTRASTLDDPSYDAVPGFKEFTDYAKSPNLKSFPSLPFFSEYSDALTKAVNDILRGKTTIDDGLAGVKKTIQPLVK
ncbi:ABC transporter substrate-binding protein [Cohnella sp. CBP 2801]|uniref:ABC transporter substrate-binding protein n=2 Tax=Cohnella zeiphila TaxID=2761120 RepID=A0A7X0SJT9_9BACL|nr:ABC transporter substrate-binding protein [Cohnella zeiphila]